MTNYERREMERFNFIINRGRRLDIESKSSKNESKESEQDDPRQIDPFREEPEHERQLQFNWPKR